jgi:hypothetical protein
MSLSTRSRRRVDEVAPQEMSSQTQYWPGDLTSIILNSANPRFDFMLKYYDAVNDWPSYFVGSVNVSPLLPFTAAISHHESPRAPRSPSISLTDGR